MSLQLPDVAAAVAHGRRKDIFIPVSYTHLDVYKRQDRGQHTGLLHALFQAALCPAGKPAAAPGRALSGRRAASGKAASAHLS